MRESWTDERLDDLREGIADFRGETKQELAVVREEFAAVRGEIKDESRAMRAEMKEGFRSLHERFDAMQRLMIQFQGLMIAALIGLIATQL